MGAPFAKRSRGGYVVRVLASLAALAVAVACNTASQAQTQPTQASPPTSDRYACGADILMQAVKALGYKGDADFWKAEKADCRLRPGHPNEAIVALTYTHGDQLSGNASDNDDAGYDLDLAIIRTDNGSLVARNAPGAHVDSDAIRFEGIAIDTANFTLAPGQRAFGVRIEHYPHCYRCQYSQTDLTLYLQRGKHLDAILDTMVRGTRGEGGATECDAVPSETTRTLKVATSTSHGLADLLLTSTTHSMPDEDTPAACKTDADASVAKITLSFDGKSYPVPAGFDPH